jgi:hypothetical protein
LSIIFYLADPTSLPIISGRKHDEVYLVVNPIEGKKRGRRKIPDLELLSDRNHLFALFDAHWADLGWQLENLRNVLDVPTAVKVLPRDDRHYAVRLLVKPVTMDIVDPTVRDLAHSYKELTKNVEVTKESIAGTQKYVDSLDRMLRHEMSESERNIVTSEKKTAEERLSHFKDTLISLVNDKNNTTQRLEHARAHFARSELVKFCQSDRSRLNPRRMANAVAGLPFISWRQSAMRCVTLETNRSPGGFRYQTFRVVGRIIKAWDRKLTSQGREIDELVDSDELARHARLYLETNRKTPARIFSELWKNFRCLRKSIEQVSTENPYLGARAYRITSEYFRLSGSSRPELESFLANRESIKHGKIRVVK